MLNRMIAMALLAATPVLAQVVDKPTAGVVIVPAGDLAQRVDGLGAKPGAPASSTITSTDKYITLFSHRAVDGMPERHANWTDVMMVLKGEVTLTYGGTISGNTVGADGESHGGTITGGTRVTLHAGDYLLVPAGTPHWMTGPKGDYRYFVTKVHI